MTRELSHCCSDALHPQGGDATMTVRRCQSCGSLWFEHRDVRQHALPWQDLSVTETFTRALQRRREVQAEAIWRRFPELHRGRLLDYGTGQATFPTVLRRHGVDAWGCDIDLEAPGRAALTDGLIQLPAPWAIPDDHWSTISLLDVIEHHPEPLQFLSQLPADRLLVKVPLATGPLARTARGMARLRRPQLLAALALADDASPHQVLFTRRGLVSLCRRAGWRLERARAIADVGAELPDRMRLDGVLASSGLRPAVAVVGFGVAALARVWSDTAVMSFSRVTTSPTGGAMRSASSAADAAPTSIPR